MSLNRYRKNGLLLLEYRRTADGKPWLSKLSRDQIAYCLGYASSEPGTVVHGAFVHGDVSLVLATDTSGLFSRFTQRFHTALTELANHAHKRESGTIWDNRKPSESIVLGWFPALYAFSLLAIRAAAAAGTDNPYDCPGYFGPELWGTATKVDMPAGFNARSRRPWSVWLNPKVPDCAPDDFSLEELVADADFEMLEFIARAQERLRLSQRPGRRTYDRRPTLTKLPGVIAEENVARLFDAELRAWRAYYQRCRREFCHNQRVVFPAGTDRFQTLGAVVTPCPIYVAPPQPRRSLPPPPRPPPTT